MSRRLRDPSKPPPHLSGRSRSNWIKNARKELQNYQYQQQFPSFYIPTPCYQIYHIHHFTRSDIVEMIIDHFKHCKLYSVDTECDCYTNKIALIQIHSIPSQFPSFVLFVELNHLPSPDQELFSKLRFLFELLFRDGNRIYCWGPPLSELEKALHYSLFSFPLGCDLINLQQLFKPWVERELPLCAVCLSDSDDLRECSCKRIPHVGTNEHWSLQNAICYVLGQFLDKSNTKFTWSSFLDPNYSTLPSSSLQNVIRYAAYDTLAVSYFHRVIENNWTLQQLQHATISMLLLDPHLHILNYDLEPISDNELPPVTPPSITNSISALTEPPSSTRIPSQPGPSSKRSHSHRSVVARIRRNRKRTLQHRSHRYRHRILRPLYHRFTLRMVKHILHQHHIHFLHVNRSDNNLVIGIKNSTLRDEYDQLLPLTIFNRKHYLQFKH